MDELEELPEGSEIAPRAEPIGEIRALGPALSFLQSCRTGLIGCGTQKLVSLGDFSTLRDFLRSDEELTSASDRRFSLARVGCTSNTYDMICQYALTAVKRGNLQKSASHQVISALCELYSNVIEHAGRLEDSFFGYEVSNQFVGIYVTDLGMGSLASLRKNPQYSGLNDHGDSLRLCIQEGVSGKTEPGRGFGFRPIFHGLAELAGYMRFRSGDALLEISGVDLEAPTFGIKERPVIAGFHAYVHCRLTP